MSSSNHGLLWTSCFLPPSLTPYSLPMSRSHSLGEAIRASLLSLLIQCWKMSSQILLERVLADGLRHKWWGGKDKRGLRLCVCTTVWLSVCVHVCLQWCMHVYVSDLFLSHIHATSHISECASQAKIKDMPCYFIIYQSILYEGGWCNVLPRGFDFWNNILWHVHINKCIIYYYLSQSLCFRRQLSKQGNDSTYESFYMCCSP